MSASGRRLLIGLTVAALLLAIGLWLLLRGLGKDEAESPGVAAGPPQPPPATGPAAQIHLPHLDLGLLVNLGAGNEVVQGTPLLLTVTLCHLDAEEAERLRIRAQAVQDGRLPVAPDLRDELEADWQERLAALPAAPVKLMPSREDLAGWLRLEMQSDGSWSDLPWPLEALAPAPAADAEVGTESLHWELAIGPQAAASIPVGELTLRACLTAQTEPKAAEDLVSLPATVRVVAKDGAPPQTALASAHIAGLYHLDRGDFAAAEQLARETLATAPKRVKSWVLLAQAKEGQGDPKAALKAYGQAINLIAETGTKEPPPRFLIERRRALLWGGVATSQPATDSP
jgi:hypothetical protein